MSYLLVYGHSLMLESLQVPRNVVEDELRALFQQFGTIVEFEMPQLRQSGQGDFDSCFCVEIINMGSCTCISLIPAGYVLSHMLRSAHQNNARCKSPIETF